MHFRSHLAITVILSLTTTSQSFSQQQRKVNRKDFGKLRIERPLEISVLTRGIESRQKTSSQKKKPFQSGSIFATERPTRRIIRKNSIHVVSARNPKIEPGKILWYSKFEDTLSASQQSGKPVLLFFMVGKLDERFS